MDSVRVIITRNVNTDGSGGTVVDDAAALLQAMPDGSSALDGLMAAFATHYPIPPSPTGAMVSDENGNDVPEMRPAWGPIRHISMCIKNYAMNVMGAFIADQERKEAERKAQLQQEAVGAAVQLVSSVANGIHNTPEVI